jgi:hypothetical protein
MIHEVIESLRTKITGLPFIEKYGGLVRIAKKAFTNDEGIYYKTFPVSCDVSNAECWNNDRYKDLLPDENYKSIAYFESAGNIIVKKTQYLSSGRDAYHVIAPIDFICWLNLPKLGISDCHSSIFELMAVDLFYQSHKPQLENFNVASFKMEIKSFSSRDEKIFAKYSYGDLSGLLLYPFDFFKISLELSFYIDPNCIQNFVLNPPIDCP